MTTKEQERTALEKIRKIVADLGENSYLGSAFDGAFDLAEQNIDMDAAFSATYYISQVHILERDQRAEAQRHNEIIKNLERNLANANTALDGLQTRYDTVYGQFHEANAARLTAEVEVSEREAALTAKDDEIIRLKAKLYDPMTQGA